MTRRLSLAGLLAALIAFPAFAAPTHNGSVSAAAPEFKWSGGPINGVVTLAEVADAIPCNTPGVHECEDTLLEVKDAGAVSIKLEGKGDAALDIDLYVYKSDASGEPGDEMGSSTTDQPTEAVTARVKSPGYILVRADVATGANVTYDATATLKAGTTTGQPPAGNAAPAAAIKKASRKGFSGTATDDGSVAKVEVGVVLRKGKKCKQMTAKGTFKKLAKCTEPTTFVAAKGTSTWSFKPKRKLKKGSYTVYARATDDTGQAQAGFGPANRKTFKVK